MIESILRRSESEGLVGDFVFNETNNRAVAVDTAIIGQVMRELYHAGRLADELQGKM